MDRFSQESDKFSSFLEGPGQEKKRFEIYHFLLNHLTEEQKFQLSVKLCVETLHSVPDGAIDIGVKNGSAVVSDTLHILSSNV